MSVHGNTAQTNQRKSWYTGFTYNATIGSRAEITVPISRGMVMAYDPFAYTGTPTAGTNGDRTFQESNSGSSALPTGSVYGQMVLDPPAENKPGGNIKPPIDANGKFTGDASATAVSTNNPNFSSLARLVRNVTRPETAILGLFAGIVRAPHPDMKIWGSYLPGAGPQMLDLIVESEVTYVLVTCGSAIALGDILLPTAGQFYATPVAPGSITAAQLCTAIGKVLCSDAGSANTLKLLPCKIGPLNAGING